MPTAIATHLGEIRPITEFVPSPLNFRKVMDKTKLDELTASIKSKGIIEPLVARTRPGFGQLEIVAGERRYRAGKAAGLEELPVIIRQLTDIEVLELMAIENSQRDDLHPLEEAEGFGALMKADPAYTPKGIAAKIGKSERYVQQRLSLARLESAVQKAFLENHITAGHADLIARLSADEQKAALKACFDNLYGEDKERGCCSVRTLNHWITEHVRLQLDAANPELETFPELGKLLEKADEPDTLLQVHRNYGQEVKGALGPRAYKVADGKKDRCQHAERAVVVLGQDRGHIVEICRASGTCLKHWRWEIDQAKPAAKKASSSSSPKTAKADRKALADARRKQQEAEARTKRREAAIHIAAGQLKKKPIKPGPAVLAVLRATSMWSAKSWADVVAAALEDLFAHNDGDWKKAVALLKPFGVKLDAIEGELAEKDTSSTKAQTSASAKQKTSGVDGKSAKK